MPSLASHANVWNSCLELLQRKGYRLEVELDENEDGSDGVGMYVAERDGFSFWADNPIELLGLTALYEAVEPAQDVPGWWSALNDPALAPGELRDALIEQAIKKREARHAELEALRVTDGPAWEVAIRSAFENGES